MAVRRTASRRLFDRASYLAFLAFRRAVNLLPWGGAYALGDLLALGWWCADARHRRLALANLRIAFPAWAEGKRRRTAFRAYRNLCWTLVETLRYEKLAQGDGRRRAAIANEEVFERARDAGKGVLAISAHLGNWEWLSAHALRFGTVHIVARAIHNPEMDREIRVRREAAGVRQIYPDRESPRAILKALRAGEAVCFLVDQSAKGEEGVDVPFFGRPAPTHTGPALLALRTGATVISVFARRLPDRRIELRYGEPLALERTGDLDRDVKAATALFTRVVEDAIRERPDQWFWVHDRWRIRRRKRRRR